MYIDNSLTVENLKKEILSFWNLSANKIQLIEQEYNLDKGSPIFTVQGKYTTRGWTEWTQGFLYGSSILQYDATGDETFLEIGRNQTVKHMASHVGHFGVHDHGFNNVSTYGNLLRLMKEGKIPYQAWEKHFYELALKLSGAIQAKRWATISDGTGYIYSFNGPHSLFVDTIRSCRALLVSHALGFELNGEHDAKIDLMERALIHGANTARYSVFYGEGRDQYDVYGRTAHECIFNINDGHFRCPNTQQGYSGFSTWTRGLSWAMCGFPEMLEFIGEMPQLTESYDSTFMKKTKEIFLKAAKATCDFYIANTASDGIPYWDTGAPNLFQLGEYREKAADPFNEFEPVDSSAAAIGAQGLLRLGKYLGYEEGGEGHKYWQAGLTVAKTLLGAPYLSTDEKHQGMLLHSVYHWPNKWDYVPEGSQIPYGESSMWGDYHVRELMLYLHKIQSGGNYYTFFRAVMP